MQLMSHHIVETGHHGWQHWYNGSVEDGLRPNMDILPDVSEYDSSELYEAPGLKTKSGEQCYVFSSRNQNTVDRLAFSVPLGSVLSGEYLMLI
jgi:hypothetical protein